MQSSLLSHIKRTKKRQGEKENDLPLPSVLLSPHQRAQQVFPSALLSPPLPAPPRPLLNISRAPGGMAATSPPLSISHESSFSLRMRTTLLVCVPSHDATSACRVSLLPSPAELAVLDKICWLSWRRYCTKTTSPELLGKLLQVMQVASNSRGFHSGQGKQGGKSQLCSFHCLYPACQLPVEGTVPQQERTAGSWAKGLCSLATEQPCVYTV